MNKFIEYYKKEKETINKKLIEFNNSLLTEKNPIIKENIELFKNLNSDGKIIRGTLVNLGYYLIKEDKDYSNDLSLAYEVFQTAILIHDDIIDNDSKRRGKDTIHYANINKYKDYSQEKEELKNLGDAVAICMGDYGLYLSNKIIINSYNKDDNFSKVLSYFNDTVINTIKGELLDVTLPFRSKYKIEEDKNLEEYIMNIYKLKTAYYTIIGPLSTGMILAGTTSEELKDIEKFGELVGIAFQIQDDLLGIYSEETGKVKGSDIKEFKQTILYSYTCNTKYKDSLLKYYGQDNLTEENIKEVKEIFEICGAKEYAKQMMNNMYDESLNILNNISWIKEDKKDLLRGFVEFLKTRNK